MNPELGAPAGGRTGDAGAPMGVRRVWGTSNALPVVCARQRFCGVIQAARIASVIATIKR